jgi:hypothetical protein
VGLRRRSRTVYAGVVRIFASVIVLAAIAACDVAADDSCGVPTAEISLVASAVENGPTLRTEIELSKEDSAGVHALILCDADVLHVDGHETERIDRPDRVIYSHTSEMVTSRTVELELRRDEGESVMFTIDVPPSFEVLAPMAEAEVSRSSDFLLEWAPANPGNTMRIALAEEIGMGVCLETMVEDHDYKGLSGVDIEDDGNWNIPATVLDAGARETCDAQYRFTRVASSAYPDAFGPGGYLEGRVERLVAFVSVP